MRGYLNSDFQLLETDDIQMCQSELMEIKVIVIIFIFVVMVFNCGKIDKQQLVNGWMCGWITGRKIWVEV